MPQVQYPLSVTMTTYSITQCHCHGYRYTPPEQLPVMTRLADIIIVATGTYILLHFSHLTRLFCTWIWLKVICVQFYFMFTSPKASLPITACGVHELCFEEALNNLYIPLQVFRGWYRLTWWKMEPLSSTLVHTPLIFHCINRFRL